jgi:hypothetical protein
VVGSSQYIELNRTLHLRRQKLHELTSLTVQRNGLLNRVGRNFILRSGHVQRPRLLRIN